MLKIEEYVCNLKESNTIFIEPPRIHTHQSSDSYHNTQFQNPIYKIVPPEYFQSVIDNKYSNIFSSYIQSPKNEQIESKINSVPQKRTFTFAESYKLNKDPQSDISVEFGQTNQLPNQKEFKLLTKFSQEKNLTDIETLNKQKIVIKNSQHVLNNSNLQQNLGSPKNNDVYDTNQSFDEKKTQATLISNTTFKDNNKELELIFKECENNFSKNRALKTEEYIACNMQ